MIGLLCFVLAVLATPFKSKLRLEAENAVLRHQLIVLRRRLHGRVRPTNNDRWFFIQLYRWFPSILQVITIIRPETLVRWHRAGFRCYWRWKSRPLGGRPQIHTELRALIRRMNVENPLWGAPRIHGELLKLGFEVAQSSVAKYMVKRRGPPSQGWRTFLRNHASDIAAMDLFVVPTIGFDLLYAFVIVRLDRRDLVWINVTANPTAEWVARQITEAFPWNEAPRYMIRDRDRIYGPIVTRRLRAMGIRDKPIAPASPWQNGFVERLIGSIRRECLDHVVVLGEAHLRRILRSYAAIMTTSERIGHWTRTRRFLARFSGPEASVYPRYLVDFTITASGFRFTYTQATAGQPYSSFTIYLAFAASALRCSALPIRHVTQIRQDQPEFLIAQVLFGKAGHPLLGPNPNRARISDQRAQTGIGEVLRRVHRQIQIGAKRRRSCLVHRMACGLAPDGAHILPRSRSEISG